jgi:hypothetical protein
MCADMVWTFTVIKPNTFIKPTIIVVPHNCKITQMMISSSKKMRKKAL